MSGMGNIVCGACGVLLYPSPRMPVTIAAVVHGGGRCVSGGRERDAAPREDRADDLGALVRRGEVDVQELVEAPSSRTCPGGWPRP